MVTDYRFDTPRPHSVLNITKRCNQRCVFCFEGARQGWGEPSLDQAKRILREAGRLSPRVTFMGAEALLRPDILEVVRYGSARGLKLCVFTNGQAFARPGFAGALAEAGLRNCLISAHYAEAEDFARGTRTPAGRFASFRRGLENLRRHNEARPDRRISVCAETVLSRFNLGKLLAIKALLRGALGSSLDGYMIKDIAACPTSSPERLIEPLAPRRAELARFMPLWERDIPFSFSQLPLCLFPGWEHCSLDVVNIAAGIRMFSNFEDKSRLGDLHTYLDALRSHPYRWLCRGCTLAAICPCSLRVSWHFPAFAPDPGQRPIPFRERTPEEVLSRIPGFSGLGLRARARRSLAARRAAIRAVPMPEEALRRALLARGGLGVQDLACGRQPVFEARGRHRGRAFSLRVGFPRPERELGWVVGCLDVRPAAAARALAAARLPALRDWEGFPGFDAGLAGLAQRLWKLFGRRLWPGAAWGGWRARGLRAGRASLALSLRSPAAGSAELLFQDEADPSRYPVELGVLAGLRLHLRGPAPAPRAAPALAALRAFLRGRGLREGAASPSVRCAGAGS